MTLRRAGNEVKSGKDITYLRSCGGAGAVFLSRRPLSPAATSAAMSMSTGCGSGGGGIRGNEFLVHPSYTDTGGFSFQNAILYKSALAQIKSKRNAI